MDRPGTSAMLFVSPPKKRRRLDLGHLSIAEKQCIINMYKKFVTDTPELNTTTIVHHISNTAGIAKSSVYRVVKEYRETGNITASKRCGGRPAIVSSINEYTKNYKDYETSSSIANKGKYYKQTYRTAWEQMPDFKGWLRGMPGEPTRAFCLYCQKSLHAHRLSLLKHTSTTRHQKAAQLNFIHQEEPEENSDTLHGDSTIEQVNLMVAGPVKEEIDEAQNHLSSYEEDDIDDDQDHDEDVEEEEIFGLEELPAHLQKEIRPSDRVSIMTSKPVISTHVLDTSKGQAVSGLQVSLYKLIDGSWTYINEGLTNPDGWFSNFLSRDDFSAGRYKLHFDVDRYFELRKMDSMYPFIEIVFDCRAPGDHYHIPLLLGLFGYTTYRGT